MGELIKKGFKTEDWLAVWLGFLIIALVLIGVRPQMPTFKWTTAGEFSTTVAESKPKLQTFIKDAETKGERSLAVAATNLKNAIDGGNRVAIQSAAKKLGEIAKTVEDPGLRKKGGDLSKKLSEGAGALASKVFSTGNILKSVYIGVGFLVITMIGIVMMGGKVSTFIIGFPIVYGLAWLSQFIAGNTTINYLGFEYVIFALLVGLFISNVIGVAALLISIWWALKKGKQSGERPSIRVIWERFPKFVLGFLVSSFVFSFLLDPRLVKETKGILSGVRTFWFALAFTSIGLETRFTELFKMGGGRPAIAFIGAQTFNVIWTLLLAYLLFGGFIFPTPVIK